MAEMISKWAVVDKLTSLKNEFQHFKPFEGFEHAMYRKLCEVEMEIGKMPAVETPIIPGHSNQYNISEMAYNNGYAKGMDTGKPKWIPVTERLPEHDYEDVLVCDRDLYWISFTKTKRNGEKYFVVDGNCVTHWMPLPEPPKEDKYE